jgi:hypothetical protein
MRNRIFITNVVFYYICNVCSQNDCMNDLLYYVLFTSISHSIVNLVEISSFRLVFVIQRTFLRIKRQWSKFQNNQDTSQSRVLELHTKLPASYLPPEGISCEYCECLLMLSWSILFSSALPIVSLVLSIVFLARCRLLLQYEFLPLTLAPYFCIDLVRSGTCWCCVPTCSLTI